MASWFSTTISLDMRYHLHRATVNHRPSWLIGMRNGNWHSCNKRASALTRGLDLNFYLGLSHLLSNAFSVNLRHLNLIRLYE